MKEKKADIEEKASFPKMATGYGVPEGYFETFGERLKRRMEEEQKTPETKGIVFYLKPALSIAAGLAILLSVYLHYPVSVRTQGIATVSKIDTLQQRDQLDQFASTYSSLVSDAQLISAIAEMDEYDASKMSKDALADYLATNCSDFEILNANK